LGRLIRGTENGIGRMFNMGKFHVLELGISGQNGPMSCPNMGTNFGCKVIWCYCGDNGRHLLIIAETVEHPGGIHTRG